MRHGTERRVRRTQDKQQAMNWFLQSRLLRQGLRGLVLGSREGLVVAAAGDGVCPEAAAAFAPFVFHDDWDFPEPVEEAYFVDAVPLPDTTLYLFAVGRSGASAQATKTGIRRILQE